LGHHELSCLPPALPRQIGLFDVPMDRTFGLGLSLHAREPVLRTLTWINTACGPGAAVAYRPEEVPMRILALAILTMSIVLTAGQARAQTYDPAYPVCLYVVSFGASPYYRCRYTTMDQCRASANGQMCSLNPYYAGATAPERRNKRHYDRQAGSRSPAPAETGSYATPGPPIHRRAARYNLYNEPYYGASQGYAPGEKQRFLESVTRRD
jgi:Protein of unknown function (DUF3551)